MSPSSILPPLALSFALQGDPTPSIKPFEKIVSLLWLLWEIYHQNIGLERLKRCPQCKEWFVDRRRTIRKSVAHCIAPGNGGPGEKGRRKGTNYPKSKPRGKERKVNLESRKE